MSLGVCFQYPNREQINVLNSYGSYILLINIDSKKYIHIYSRYQYRGANSRIWAGDWRAEKRKKEGKAEYERRNAWKAERKGKKRKKERRQQKAEQVKSGKEEERKKGGKQNMENEDLESGKEKEKGRKGNTSRI